MKQVELEEQNMSQQNDQKEEVIITFDGKNNGKFFNKRNLKYFLYVNLGVLLTSIGIYFFKTPNGFATGGVSGISVVLHNIFPAITPAVYMLVINVLLLIIGFVFLGKGCGILTCYCSLMISLETLLFEQITELNQPLTSEPLLELIYAVLLTGIGSAILFKFKASSGGTDIIALIFKKYTDTNVGKALLYTDFFIALATFINIKNGEVIFTPQVGLFSLLGLFAKVFIIDDIIDSINLCKSFTIITTKPDEINDYITKEMAHSATIVNGEGAYSHQSKTVIMTVCRKSEAIKLRRAVTKIDPGAFLIITKTSEIMGRGFRDTVN